MPTLQIMVTPFQGTQWYLVMALLLVIQGSRTATALSTGEAWILRCSLMLDGEVIWLCQLLTEIGFSPRIGTTLHIDNTSRHSPWLWNPQIKLPTAPAYQYCLTTGSVRSPKTNYRYRNIYLSDRNLSDIFTREIPCTTSQGTCCYPWNGSEGWC